MMEEKIIKNNTAVVRHGWIEITEHWVLAISGFLLIFSGFGELPMYKRYMVTQIPGLSWAGDFFIHLKIHYLAGIAFVSVMVFHALYHGWLGHQGLLPRKGDVKASFITILSLFGFGEEPKSDKYLPEQRLAYAYIGAVGFLLVITGVIKVIKNLPGVYLSPTLITSATLIHTFATLFFLLGVIAHLAALVFKVNRPLVKSIFTGEVNLGYVQERHTIWYEALMKNKVQAKVGVEGNIAEEGEDKGQVEAPVNEEVKVEDKVKTEGSDQAVTAVAIGEETMAKEERTMSSIIKVKGMSCQHCVMSITKALGQLEGIQNVQVDLEKGEVRFDNTKGVAPEQIEKAILEAGYQLV